MGAAAGGARTWPPGEAAAGWPRSPALTAPLLISPSFGGLVAEAAWEARSRG